MGASHTVPLYGWDAEHIEENPMAPRAWLPESPWNRIDLLANTIYTVECLSASWECISDIAIKLKPNHGECVLEFTKVDDKKHNNCRCFLKSINHTIVLTGNEEKDRKQLMECRTLWLKTKKPNAHRTHGILNICSSQNCTIYFNPLV
jgi:hypothetical protein